MQETIMDVKKNLVITIQLKSMLKEFDDKIKHIVLQGVVHYINEYKYNLISYDNLSLAASFQSHLDKVIQKALEKTEYKISCRKGCCFCCYQHVEISDHEAQLILEWCRDKKIKIDWEYLKKQISYTRNNWINQEHKKCVFLKKGLCSIYDIRPMVCRKYFVTSEPEDCKMDVLREVSVFADMEAETVVSAIMNIIPFHSLSESLLRFKDI
jgi:Fe-S-cluster containining protein